MKNMKKMFWLVGGLCAATVGFLAWGARRSEPVEDLAHRDEPKSEEPNFDEAQADEFQARRPEQP
jgi:hypothetical protein